LFARLALGAAVFALSGCALFTRYTLTIALDPPTGGAVSIVPEKTSYRSGEQVTLTAYVGTGYAFDSYEGDLVSTTATSTLVMDADKSVTVVFTVEGANIDVRPSAAAGTVSMELIPRARGYYAGDQLVLTAVANPGWEFLEWRGNLTGSANPAELLVSVPFSVTAVFQAVYGDVTRADTYTAAGSEGFLVDTVSRVDVQYTLDLGADPRDVFFVFSNVGEAATSLPTVTKVSGSFGARVAPVLARPAAGLVSATPRAIRGNPRADAFTAESAARLRAMSRVSPRALIPPPFTDVAGTSTGTFYYESTTVGTIPATCRAVVRAGSDPEQRLSVWVANDQWDTRVTQPMVDALAERFLRADGAARIYQWITGIFGDEWGSTQYSGLIGDNDSITILLYDIDGDGTAFIQSGGIVGFFYSKDNFVRSSTLGGVPYSNERIMFYLDAPMLATADGGWAITDSWPREVVSTLAHEFQHMIHYYQKDILRSASYGSAGVWLNEMCSMVAEDLVSDKLGVPGPRGVDPTISPPGSAGVPGNTGGFLPQYNYFNETPVAYWPPWNADIDTQLSSYATNYAFGAYLARNFGGADLFRAIVQNAYGGRAAVDEGLRLSGFGAEDFGSALRKWGTANLLSDGTADAGHVYNTGGWITHGAYNLGSINLYNYDYVDSAQSIDWTGPYIWSAFPADVQHEPSSTWYYAAARGATGALAWQIRLEQDTRLEVVVKVP
jgi:hypothetical protein